LAVQGGDGFVAVIVIGHLNEAEAAGTSGVAVGHDAYPVHGAIGFEKLAEFVLIGVKAQIAHEDILHASAPALSCLKCEQFGGLGRPGEPFLKIETGSWRTVKCAEQYSRFS
jgi:hypothetical protein